MRTNTYEVTSMGKNGVVGTQIFSADSEYECRDGFKAAFGVEPIRIRKVPPAPVRKDNRGEQ